MFIDSELLKSISIDEFRERSPYPWFEISNFLTPASFELLRRSFPPVELFEWHSDLTRRYGQRPHNRYYLAYEESVYHRDKPSGEGVVQLKDLAKEWVMFIKELQRNEPYLRLVKSLFEVPAFNVRFAWHIGITKSEVSPHVDSQRKLGTHIFYFNTHEDWDAAWGGSTLVMSLKSSDTNSPDFTDFGQTVQIQNIGNRSFLFKNGSAAWHGMKPLKSPEGVYRRTFNIIFESSRDRRPLTISRGRSVLRRALNRLKN